MTVYCLPQRHLVDSRSKEGSSRCWNVNNNRIKKLYYRWIYITYKIKLTCAMPETILLPPDSDRDAAAATTSSWLLASAPWASRVLVWASWTKASVARFTAFPAFYTANEESIDPSVHQSINHRQIRSISNFK